MKEERGRKRRKIEGERRKERRGEKERREERRQGERDEKEGGRKKRQERSGSKEKREEEEEEKSIMFEVFFCASLDPPSFSLFAVHKKTQKLGGNRANLRQNNKKSLTIVQCHVYLYGRTHVPDDFHHNMKPGNEYYLLSNTKSINYRSQCM